ncbi:MAG: neutral zinc metallopeptidase [Acidimicrobiia bacterium]
MRRVLSGIVGVVVLVGASSGAALAAPSGGDDDARVGGGDSDELTYPETIEFALEDIQAFWDETLPDAYGLEYRELRDEQILPYDEDTPNDELPACGEESVTYEDVADNAFYCVLGADEEEDFVAYDDGTLFPRLFEDFGAFSLVQVLAHEWGHAIQGQTSVGLTGGIDGFIEARSIQKELQADCFAGAYVRWVDDEESEAFRLDPGDLETGLAGMLEFKDPAGTDPGEQGAHGNGFDRANAFSEGFEQGATRCAEYDQFDTLGPIVTEIPFSTEEDLANEGNLPLDEAIDFGMEDLDFYWQAVFDVSGLTYDGVEDVDGYDVRRRSALPECEALGLDPDRPKKYRGQVFYCPGEDFIAYDESLIEAAHGEIGDFGAMLLIGNAWAAGMQDDLELDGGDLQADCFTGAWAGSIPLDLDGDALGDFAARGTEVIRDPNPPLENASIFLSPGDLDEVVSAFLAFSEPSTADGAELSAFERLASFREGFFSVTAEEDCEAVTG